MVPWLLQSLRPLGPFLCHVWRAGEFVMIRGTWARRTGVEPKVDAVLPLLRYVIRSCLVTQGVAAGIVQPLAFRNRSLAPDHLHQV